VFENLMALDLEMEAEHKSQGIQETSRSWKGKGVAFSSRVSRRNIAHTQMNKLILRL
jgi:hypothetical protein